MRIFSGVAVALIVAVGQLGCAEGTGAARPAGAIELVMRSASDAHLAGTFEVRSAESSRTWRVPMRREPFQTRRLLLEPGLYALDFQADVGAALEGQSPSRPPQPLGAELPRWVVVAPARVTTVNISTRAETGAPCLAGLPSPSPGSLEL